MRGVTLPAIFVLLTVSTALSQSPGASRQYEASYNTVWQALIDTVSEYHFEVRSQEKVSGILWLEEQRSMRFSNEVVKRWTTKKVGTFGNWAGFASRGSIRVRPAGDSRTEVICEFEFFGYQGFWKRWERLGSNGSLEAAVLNSIQGRIAAAPPLQSIASGNSHSAPVEPELLHGAEELLSSLRKVDAAFKIGASPDLLSSALVDCQVRFDEFSASPYAASIPLTLRAASESLEGFKRARTHPTESSDDLNIGRAALTKAAQLFAGYRSDLKEAPVSAKSPMVESKPKQPPSSVTVDFGKKPN
ncbi:MAG: hypothetical protein ACRD2L_11270 [Terriglobia bacterium]